MLSGCPFCHHSESSLYREDPQLHQGGLRHILRCNECGILYPQRRMDEEEMKISLPQSGVTYEEPCVDTTDTFVGTFLKEIKKQGRSLDVGTWSGKFTYIFQALGFDSYGLELQKEAVDFAQGKGLKVLHGSFPNNIPQILLSHKYHLVAMLEMIYYLHDLKRSLMKVNEMLQDNGVFLIQFHQGYSKYYDTVYNNSYFSRYGNHVQGIPTLSSMQYCLDKSGFKVVKFIGATEHRLQRQLSCTGVTIESADRLCILAGKA